MSPAEKRQMYSVLGGNHRAIEWAGQLLKQEHQQTAELVAALSALHAPPETPEGVAQVVVEAMRQNLLFARLRSLLTPTQDRLLRAASLYRVPVNEDGLLALTDQSAQSAEDWPRLATYSLLEWGHDPELALDYWLVPPVVRELLHDHGFSPSELQALHRAMGRYHRFQEQYVSRHLSDAIEAIYHFRQAREHAAADEIAGKVSTFYYLTSNFIEAKVLTEDIVQRVSPSPPWWALNRYGLCQLVLGFYDSALAAFEHALPIAPTLVDKAATLNNLGEVFRARGDYDTALRYLEASLATRRNIGDKAGEGTTLSNLGEIYLLRADHDTALRYLEASLAISREIGDKEGEGRALNNLSAIYQERSDYDTALRYLEASLAIRREIGDKLWEGRALIHLGLTCDARGDYDTALRYLETGLAISREIGDKEGESKALIHLGLTCDARGDHDTALRYLEAALAICRQIGDKTGEGRALIHLSAIYNAQGDYNTALRYLEASLAIRREIGDKAGEGTTLHNLGTLAYARGDYNTALHYLEASLAISREIDDKVGLVATLDSMASIAWEAQNEERAMTLWSEALVLAKETQYAEGLFHTASSLGQALALRGAASEARPILQLAVEVGKAAGFPKVQEVEAMLRRLPSVGA